MPDQSTHLADFRKSGHKVFCHASIYKGRLVMEGEVTQALPEANVEVVFYFVTSGDYLDIYPGFRVDIYTAGGLFKGRTRVRYGQTITPNTLPIRETSPGSIVFAAGDIVRVYRDVRLSDKLPAAINTGSAQFPPDGTPYTGQTDTFRPIVGSGGAYAGWTRMLPAVMTNTSAALDPDSGGSLTHLWDADGLSYASGSSSSASPTFTATWGEYCPAHTVTDTDNSTSRTQYVPVILHDKAHPPYKVQIEDLPNDEERGGSARVRWLDDAPLADVPDGALIILWKEEFIAGTRQSFGARAPGRSHLLFVGYLRREEGAGDGDTGAESLTFEVISPLARLDELMGYGKVMLRAASPDSWIQVKALTVGIAARLIPLEYTTLNEAGYDLVITGSFQDEAYSGFFVNESTPLKQMRELVHATDGRLIEDRRGRFEIQMRPELMALSARAGLTRTLSLTARDLKRWRYTREHWRPVNRIEVHGFIAGASTVDNLPLFSEWVGTAPGEGNARETVERKIVHDYGTGALNQASLNERAGRLGAARDGIYVDADGALQMALDLELTLRGVYDVFDLYDEVLELDVTTHQRGIDFSDHLFVLISSSIDFSAGTAETTLHFRTCTNGTEGTTYIPPTDTYIPPTTLPPPPPPPVLPPPPPPPPNGAQPTRALLFSTHTGQAKCAIVTDFGTWAAVDRSTGLTAGAEAVCFTDDAWDYARVLKVDTTNLQVCADIEIGTAWTTIASITSLLGASAHVNRIITDHKQSGYFAICAGSNAFIRSLDGGLTWSAPISINGLTVDAISVSDSRKLCDIAVFPFTSNSLFATAPDSSDVNNGALYTSSDGGLTWARVNACGAYGVHNRFHINPPYKRNGGAPNLGDTSMEFWLAASGNPFAGGVNWTFVSTNRGVNNFVVYAGVGSDGGLLSRMPVNMWTHNAVYGWTTDGNTIVNTDDHWTTAQVVLSTGLHPEYLDINLWPPDRDCAIVCDADQSGVAHITLDFGANWSSGLPAGFSGGVIGELSLYTVQ